MALFSCSKLALISRSVPRHRTIVLPISPPKRFTPQDVEYSLLKVLTPALQTREGTVYSFADWTMAGEGAVVVLKNGQEFRMEIVEAV